LLEWFLRALRGSLSPHFVFRVTPRCEIEHFRAAQFLDLGEKAKLFSEEKALLEKARRALTQR
jgi:hypothetical protein